MNNDRSKLLYSQVVISNKISNKIHTESCELFHYILTCHIRIFDDVSNLDISSDILK